MRSGLNVAPDFEINCQVKLLLVKQRARQKKGEKVFLLEKLKLLIKNVKATATNAF